MEWKQIAAIGVGAAGVVAFAGVAAAEPAGSPAVVTCESGSYDVRIVPGQGNWTPALEIGGHEVLHPVAFGASWERLYVVDDEGEHLVDEASYDEVQVKGGKRLGNDVEACEFVGGDAFEYEGVDYRIEYGGAVWGVVSG